MHSPDETANGSETQSLMRALETLKARPEFHGFVEQIGELESLDPADLVEEIRRLEDRPHLERLVEGLRQLMGPTELW